MGNYHLKDGNVAWQKFGDEYCLTGQYGPRPIFISVRKGKLQMRNIQTDLLEPLDPKHPDAQFLVLAVNMHGKLIEALRCLRDVGTKGKLPDGRWPYSVAMQLLEEADTRMKEIYPPCSTSKPSSTNS